MDCRALLQELSQQRPQASRIEELVSRLERDHPCDLNHQQQQLEAVWELRWSSSTQPYLQVQPWLENLQVLQPSRGRGMNLLRLKGSLAAVGGVAVIAELTLDPPQRVGVRFQRGGLIGPRLGAIQGRLLTAVNQSFPAWLDITALDEQVRICRGNNGTLFVLRRRDDLNGDALIPNVRP
jgi:hypothetical protein